MDTILKQELRKSISSMLVQRRLGNITAEKFACYVAGANSALRVIDVHYSVEENNIIAGAVGAEDASACKGTEEFERGYAAVAKVIKDIALRD